MTGLARRIVAAMRPARGRLALAFCASAAIAIWSNALWLQDGKHPAPLFAAQPVSPSGDLSPAGPVPKADPLERVPASSAGADRPTGSHGAAAGTLAQLQAGLKTLGFYDGPIDGLDGPRTRMALRLYTTAHGLGESETASERLLAHVRMASAGLPELPPPPPPAAAQRHIRAAQAMLGRLGYDPGTIDGVLGAATVRAIERFERDHGLPVTGRLSEELLRTLSRAAGMTIEEALAG